MMFQDDMFFRTADQISHLMDTLEEGPLRIQLDAAFDAIIDHLRLTHASEEITMRVHCPTED